MAHLPLRDAALAMFAACLDADPSARPSAGAVAEALSGLARGAGVGHSGDRKRLRFGSDVHRRRLAQ